MSGTLKAAAGDFATLQEAQRAQRAEAQRTDQAHSGFAQRLESVRTRVANAATAVGDYVSAHAAASDATDDHGAAAGRLGGMLDSVSTSVANFVSPLSSVAPTAGDGSAALDGLRGTLGGVSAAFTEATSTAEFWGRQMGSVRAETAATEQHVGRLRSTIGKLAQDMKLLAGGFGGGKGKIPLVGQGGLLFSSGGFFGLGGLSLATMMGLGPEHLIGAGLAVGGSAAGALGGAGLMGLGSLGVMGVGAGSDLAVTKSTITDVSQLYKAYTNLQSARMAANRPTPQQQMQVAAAYEAERNALFQLQQAQESEMLAQRNLTQARVDALRNIQDLNAAEEVAITRARGADLAYGAARANLENLIASGASLQDIAEAQNQVAASAENQAQAHLQVGRAAHDARVANQRGVENSTQVIQAKMQEASAIHAIAQAQFQLKQATLEAAQAGRRQVVDAEQQLKVLEANLGPAAPLELAFAKQVYKLNDLWDTVTARARGAALNIFSGWLGVAKDYTPRVAEAARQNLTLINTSLQPLFTWLRGSQGIAVWNELESVFKNNLPTAIDAFDNAVELIARTMQIVAPYVGGFTKMLDDFFKKYNDMGNQDLYVKVIDPLLYKFQIWKNLIKAAYEDLKLLFHAGAGEGDNLVVMFTHLLDRWGAWEKSAKGQDFLHTFFKNRADELTAVLHLIGAVGGAMAPIYAAMQPLVPVFTQLAQLLTPIAGALRDVNRLLFGMAQHVPVLGAAVAGAVGIGEFALLRHPGKVGGKALGGLRTGAANVLSKVPLLGGLADMIRPGVAKGDTPANPSYVYVVNEYGKAMNLPSTPSGQAAKDVAEGAGGATAASRLDKLKSGAKRAGGAALLLEAMDYIGQHDAGARQSPFMKQFHGMVGGLNQTVSGILNLSPSQALGGVGGFFSGLGGSLYQSLFAPIAGGGSSPSDKMKSFGEELKRLGPISELSQGKLMQLHNEALKLARDPDLAKWKSQLLATAQEFDPTTVGLGKVQYAFQWTAKEAGKSLQQIVNTASEAGSQIQTVLAGDSATTAQAMAQNYQLAAGAIADSLGSGAIKGSQAVGAALKEIGHMLDAALRALGKSGQGASIESVISNASGAGLSPSQAISHGVSYFNWTQSGGMGGMGPHGGHNFSGGKVTAPGYFAGEEAPAHPEYILATNPAYRRRNLGLWAAAGKELGVPGFAEGGYVFPFPKGEHVGWSRIDQGQDLQGTPGGPVLAIGPGVVSVGHDVFSGFGPFYPVELLTKGPWSGRSIYYGHVRDTKTGVVAAGTTIGVTQSQPDQWTAAPAGWLELGFTSALGHGIKGQGAAVAPMLHALALGHMVAASSGITMPPWTGPGGALGQIGLAGLRRVVAAANSFLGATPGGPTQYPGKIVPGIMGIAHHAATIAGLAWNAAAQATIRNLLLAESGGGANLPAHSYDAIHDPAGPFQVISSTFAQYATPGHGNRMNPLDNAIAAMRYIKAAYGSIAGLQKSRDPHPGYAGYAMGGVFGEGGVVTANRPTVAVFGEKGPETAVFLPHYRKGGKHQSTMGSDFSYPSAPYVQTGPKSGSFLPDLGPGGIGDTYGGAFADAMVGLQALNATINKHVKNIKKLLDNIQNGQLTLWPRIEDNLSYLQGAMQAWAQRMIYTYKDGRVELTAVGKSIVQTAQVQLSSLQVQLDDAMGAKSAMQEQVANLEDVYKRAKGKQKARAAQALKNARVELEKLTETADDLMQQVYQQQVAALQAQITDTEQRATSVIAPAQAQQQLAQVTAQQGRAGVIAGAAMNVGALTMQNNALGQQLAEYTKEKDQAAALGDWSDYYSLVEKIGQTNVQIAQNTQSIVDSTANMVQSLQSIDDNIASAGTGATSSGLQYLQLYGQTYHTNTVPQQLNLLQGNAGILGTQRGDINQNLNTLAQSLPGPLASMLTGLMTAQGADVFPLVQALLSSPAFAALDQAQQSSIEGVVNSLESNTNATLQNTQQILTLNGQLQQPQSFSTTAWNQFRDAIFTGMGGLLPYYASAIGIPTASNPALTGAGLGSASQQPSQAGGTTVHAYITSPTEVLDPVTTGHQLAFAMKTPS